MWYVAYEITMFATLRSVSRMKRALRKSDRGNGPRLSIAVEIEEEEDYLSTFMWYGGNCVFCFWVHILILSHANWMVRALPWPSNNFNVDVNTWRYRINNRLHVSRTVKWLSGDIVCIIKFWSQKAPRLLVFSHQYAGHDQYHWLQSQTF